MAKAVKEHFKEQLSTNPSTDIVFYLEMNYELERGILKSIKLDEDFPDNLEYVEVRGNHPCI